MLTERTKLLILIIGALVVVAGIVLAVLGVFSPASPQPTPGEEAALELPELPQAEIGVEDAVFDSENPGPLPPAGEEAEGALFAAARDAAEFFVERFGTYTNQTASVSINDLAGFMTPSMQVWALAWSESQPEREGTFSIATEVTGSEADDFSPGSRSAEFTVFTRRAETAGGAGESYNQQARVTLEQDAAGEWKVGGLFWAVRE